MIKSQKYRTIGYFNKILNHEWAVLPWIGIVQAARNHNVNLISFHGNSFGDKIKNDEQGNIIYDLAKGERLDGLITWKGNISIYMNDAEYKAFFNNYQIPIVTIEGAVHGFPCVTYGNYEGMRMIVDHLIEVHHYKKIAFIGLIKNHVGYQERYRGYSESLEAHNIHLDPELVKSWVPWESTEQGRPGDTELQQWLKDKIASGLDAIVGACDPITLWIMEQLDKIGIHVPDEIAVTGFDGFTESRVVNPPLTTVDPSWTELGYRALETMVGILQGKQAPDRTVVPARLVIAGTCGCIEHNVQFANNLVSGNLFSFSGRNATIEEMLIVSANRNSADHRKLMEELYDAFMIESKGKNRGCFLNILEGIMRIMLKERGDILVWQDVISVLQNKVISRFFRRERIKKGNILCHQGRVLIGNCAARFQARERFKAQQIIISERELSMNVVTTFELNKLMDILAESLPSLGISGCYVALYENPSEYRFPDPAPQHSRLVLAYNENGRVPLEEGGMKFLSKDIIPDKIWPHHKACNFFMKGLFFQKHQIGFVVFHGDLLKGHTYNFLSSQISSGLEGTLLIQHINNHAEILTRGIEDLSTSITEMMKNVEVIKTSMSSQENAVEREATFIEEMKANISYIANIANKSNEISQHLDDYASQGVSSVKNLISLIRDIQEKSQNIGELVELIQQIADQTKLLAFNATIEAAHAGTKGRGFNIVAKAIRKLAEDTDRSIKGVESVLTSLMQAINQSAQLSGNTITGLDIIVDNSRKNTEISTQLNVAMNQQEKGTADILASTHTLVDITAKVKDAMAKQILIAEEFQSALLRLRSDTNGNN